MEIHQAVFPRRRGRPYYVAIIPKWNTRKVELMREFYAITTTFHYPEIAALARAFDLTTVTIQNWKYQTTFPQRWDIAYDVIDWYKRGKPVDKVYQGERRPTMM